MANTVSHSHKISKISNAMLILSNMTSSWKKINALQTITIENCRSTFFKDEYFWYVISNPKHKHAITFKEESKAYMLVKLRICYYILKWYYKS